MEKITKAICYKLQFIDTNKIYSKLIINLLDNIAEGIHKIKCTNILITKNENRVEINAKIVSAILNTQTLKIFQYNTNDYVAKEL